MVDLNLENIKPQDVIPEEFRRFMPVENTDDLVNYGWWTLSSLILYWMGKIDILKRDYHNLSQNAQDVCDLVYSNARGIKSGSGCSNYHSNDPRPMIGDYKINPLIDAVKKLDSGDQVDIEPLRRFVYLCKIAGNITSKPILPGLRGDEWIRNSDLFIVHDGIFYWMLAGRWTSDQTVYIQPSPYFVGKIEPVRVDYQDPRILTFDDMKYMCYNPEFVEVYLRGSDLEKYTELDPEAFKAALEDMRARWDRYV